MKKSTTPTFLVELPLRVDARQARRLRAHFEVARGLYNALLGEAMKRLRAMHADPAWLAAHLDPLDTIPSIAHDQWERAELRVQAAVEVLTQRVPLEGC